MASSPARRLNRGESGGKAADGGQTPETGSDRVASMTFFQLVREEMQGSLRWLLFMSALGGVSNAAILAAVNAGSKLAGESKPGLSSAILFIVALILFIKTQHYILITVTVEIESIIHRLRVRLMDALRRSELLALGAIGRTQIVAAITKETAALAEAARMLAFAGQGVVLLFFVSLYIAYLSLTAFFLSVLIVGFALLVFRARSAQISIEARETAECENRLFDRLGDLLDGFKEVRLNRSRSDDLFAESEETSRLAANKKIFMQAETFKKMVFAQASVYLLLGTVVFIVPVLSKGMGVSTAQISTALLYAVGTCFGIVQSMPVLSAANAAVENIELIENKLRELTVAEASVGARRRSFASLEMRGVEFSYVDKAAESSYQIGPIDFSLNPGDLVFITGGNGSGKSTFLKLLAGLYQPDLGEIRLDGKLVGRDNIEDYRGLISAVFSDYHLFDRLFGISYPELGEVERLLKEFELAEKTHVVDGEFSKLELSGGQRKRVALIVSLLEQRPILLLDEWTADQDPRFRRKFYSELLPQLINGGLTIVAITHDARYDEDLSVNARKFRMDDGRLVEQVNGENGR